MCPAEPRASAQASSRPQPVLVDPAEVSHPDAHGPPHIAAPAAALRAPRLELAGVPDAVGQDLDGLGGTNVDEGHVFMIPLVTHGRSETRDFAESRMLLEAKTRLHAAG